ncbi:MAG: hypothetical protein ACRDP6_14275 [Actinoallomurus sp.]
MSKSELAYVAKADNRRDTSQQRDAHHSRPTIHPNDLAAHDLSYDAVVMTEYVSCANQLTAAEARDQRARPWA